MKITWIGHACFKIEEQGYIVIIDPYRPGSVPGYSEIEESADLVLCSHQHGDHAGAELIEKKDSKATALKITKLQTYHDHHQGSKRGENTMFLLEGDGVKAAHLGDLGCPLTKEQKEALSGLQVLMIPVGGFYTIDGSEAAGIVKELNPKYVIPMHFRNDERKTGYQEISTVEEFTSLMDSVTVLEDSTLNLDCGPEEQVVVLKPANLAEV